MKQTKKDIVQYMSEKSDFSKEDLNKFLEIFYEAIKESFKSGSDVELRGFGTFVLKKRNGMKNAINPRTLESVGEILPHFIASFVPGKEIKNIVSQLKV